MNIFLCGSNQLTALDQEEIKILTDYAHKHKIYILCYKSIENEVLRFHRKRKTRSKFMPLHATAVTSINR